MSRKSKINVAVLFGGRSAEHEVSLQSARNVIDAIDKEKYNPILIGIDKKGQWLLGDRSRFLLDSDNPKLIRLSRSADHVSLVPQDRGEIVSFARPKFRQPIDVVFPILHGPYGEDGTIQGLLKLANVPFVGSGVLGSAVGMDKDVMKRLLRDAKIPIARFLVFTDTDQIEFSSVARKLGLPFFVKPANMGSSVGISKVSDSAEFSKAIEAAFRYDRKILIEENVKGREIECSVLGNDNPVASVPGEILVNAEFYSYEAKYIDEHGAVLDIPAQIPSRIVRKVQTVAIRAFKALCCEGMARVDFFLKKDGTVIVNELNTIPGFTSISMYPKLWEASGISYGDLIDRLIQLAIERFKKEQGLKTSY